MLVIGLTFQARPSCVQDAKRRFLPKRPVLYCAIPVRQNKIITFIFCSTKIECEVRKKNMLSVRRGGRKIVTWLLNFAAKPKWLD